MLAKGGMLPKAISVIMTNENVPLPSEVVGNVHTRKIELKKGWNRNTVIKILKNITYLGHVSNGNTKKISYKSKKSIIIPKEERIVVKNMHEAIIDEETFEIVQDLIKSRTRVRTRSYDFLLKGLINCKECRE
jgi:hypothetical protein